MCCLPYRSEVAWSVGVVVVPGLTAVNGPVFRKDAKVFTDTFVLRGLLFRQENVLALTSGQMIQPLHVEHNLCHRYNVIYCCVVSILTMCIPADYMLFACAAQTSCHYTRSSTLSQDCTPAALADLLWDALERRRGVIFQALFLWLRWRSSKDSWVCFTWEGSVYCEVWHTGSFIFSSRTVFYTVTGFVYRNEPHWTCTEEVFAVNQLLNWWEREWQNHRLEQQFGWLTYSLVLYFFQELVL